MGPPRRLGLALTWLALAAAMTSAQDLDAGVLLPESELTDDAGLALAARVDAFYATVHALRAHVVQRFHHRVHDRDLDAEGTLSVRRPDRLRILYDGGRAFAIEGTTFRAYEPEGEIVHEGELPEEMLADLLAVVSSAIRIRDAFDVRALPARDEGEVLEVRPRVRTPRWDRAILLVGADGAVSRILVVDPTGSWLRLVLTDVEYPRSMASGELTLPTHDGATVVSP